MCIPSEAVPGLSTAVGKMFQNGKPGYRPTDGLRVTLAAVK